MNKLTIFCIAVVVSFQGFSQTKCDIRSHYGDFIKIEKEVYNNKEYLNQDVVEVDSQYCFADFVNNNGGFIHFFVVGFRSNYNEDDLIKIDNNTALQSAYIVQLQEDSLFNAIMSELTTKVIDKSVPKDTISMNTLLNIAVKYFYVRNISDEGYYVAQVCGGIIKATEQERKPFIEAFAFGSIINHYQSDEYNMYNELVQVVEKLYNMNLGVDKNERLLRAQGAVYMQMFNNKNLRDMLLLEYERKKEYLPFVLQDK